jgi:hypothetical protein
MESRTGCHTPKPLAEEAIRRNKETYFLIAAGASNTIMVYLFVKNPQTRF